MGVWVFLATEILMFGGLFVAYAIFKAKFPGMFKEGAHHLNWIYGSVNTVVLLVSSYTIASSIYWAQQNNSKKVSRNLLITFLCAATFMVIKFIEYKSKIDHGLFPGLWHYEGAEHSNLILYFVFYFAMTGLHGSHVLVGMGLITWIWLRARKGEFSKEYYTPIEGVALFWHVVDLIWIYLFPLLYLVD
jgi:cytochrome c oxidase subunit 3